MSEPFVFGGVSLEPLDLGEAVAWVEAQAAAGVGAVVVTSNIHHIRLAQNDMAFRSVLHRAELNVADGWPLVLASHALRSSTLPSRVAGVDLVGRLLESENHFRIAVLGGAPGAAELVAKTFGTRHEFVLVDPLPKGSWESDEQLGVLRDCLEEAAPNLVLVAVGAPKQELLADYLRPFACGPIVCCGAAVEILAGVRQRAPVWVQHAGLEWAFRATLEPRRLLPRYVYAGGTFVRLLIIEALERRTG